MGGWPGQELSPLVPLKLSPAVSFNRQGSKHMSKNQHCADLRRGRSRSDVRRRLVHIKVMGQPLKTNLGSHGQSEVRLGLPMKVKQSAPHPISCRHRQICTRYFCLRRLCIPFQLLRFSHGRKFVEPVAATLLCAPFCTFGC